MSEHATVIELALRDLEHHAKKADVELYALQLDLKIDPSNGDANNDEMTAQLGALVTSAEEKQRRVFAQMRDKIRRMAKQKDTKATPQKGKRKRDDASTKSTAKKAKAPRKPLKKPRVASKKTNEVLGSDESDSSDDEADVGLVNKQATEASIPATQAIAHSSDDDSDSDDDE